MSTTLQRAPKLRPEDADTSAPLSFIKRHSVSTFYALVFTISWGGFLLIVGPDGFFATGSDIAGAGALVIAAPAIAGVLLTGLVDGRAGLRALVSRLRRWRVGARWYAVALLTGPLVMGATVLGLSLGSPDFRPDIVTADDKLSIIAVGIAIGLVGPFLEELGWTGFVLPKLAPGERYDVLVKATEPGVWALHCHILNHAESPEGMFGMVTAMIVE